MCGRNGVCRLAHLLPAFVTADGSDVGRPCELRSGPQLRLGGTVTIRDACALNSSSRDPPLPRVADHQRRIAICRAFAVAPRQQDLHAAVRQRRSVRRQVCLSTCSTGTPRTPPLRRHRTHRILRRRSWGPDLGRARHHQQSCGRRRAPAQHRRHRDAADLGRSIGSRTAKPSRVAHRRPGPRCRAARA